MPGSLPVDVMANERPTAVRLYAPDHPALAVTVRARIEQRRKELIDQLMFALSWDDYNIRAGKVRGMDDALQMIDDVERELSGR